MGRYLDLGNSGFQAIRKGLYVDKTDLIEYVNSTLGTKDKLTCVSRPRRFGKSYATQMLILILHGLYRLWKTLEIL